MASGRVRKPKRHIPVVCSTRGHFERHATPILHLLNDSLANRPRLNSSHMGGILTIFTQARMIHRATLEENIMPDLPQTLLVPVDGSKNSNSAAIYAVRLAEKLSARVRLLYAFPESPLDVFGVPSESATQEQLQYFAPERFEKFRHDSAATVFQTTRQAVGDTSVELEEEILPGEAGQAILDHSANVANPLIIMGRRGLSHFREILVGSTTQRVLHHAKCPVLVIR